MFCLPIHSRRLLLPLCYVAVAAAAWAQNTDMRLFLPPDMLRQPVLSTEERETIHRALEDLQSDDPERRLGAVMLLGKYHANEAKAAVVHALEDDNPRVRRAALVSITEWRHGLSPTVVDPVLQRLTDADLEVRRAVTAMIPQMMSIWQTAQMIRPEFADRQLAPPTQKAIRAAFHDEDPVVRRNMLVNHDSLDVRLEPEAYVAMLEDPDRPVRLEALPLALSYASPEQWEAPAKAIAVGDDRVARLRLASQLARYRSHASLQLLQQLANDPDPEIAAEARLAIFRLTGEKHYLEALVDSMRRGALTQEQSLRLLGLLRNYRELARPLATELTELPSAVLRREAARLFFDLEMATSHPKVIDRLLTDSNRDIRQLSIQELLVEPTLLTAERQDSLLDNPYPDVRGALVQVALRQPPEARADLLLDLLLDESVQVRVGALDAISRVRIDGWADIVAASLDDPDSTMQRTAATILLNNPEFPDRNKILRNYADANPESPLTPRIRAAVRAGELIEIDMNNL